MVMEGVGDLKNLWSERAAFYGPIHDAMDTLIEVYNGSLPSEFDDYFHEDMHVHVVNAIRLSWDDLAALAGKIFNLYVDPDNDTPTARRRAEHQEQIGYGYNDAGRRAGGISMKMLMKVLMWWMVGCANAVGMVLPSYKINSPRFVFRDPRTHYPPVGWSPYTEAGASDALFAYQKTVAQLKAEYPDKADELSQRVRSLSFPMLPTAARGEDETLLWVGEYYHEDTWMVATLEDKSLTFVRSDRADKGHPGVMPVTAASLYNADTVKGRSMFTDQISIQAAIARMLSQKLDFFDRTLYPLIFTTPLAGKTVRVGPWAINEWDLSQAQGQPKVESIGPVHSIEADQTLSLAMGLSRMLNRNPEQMQGVAPSGRADSAKALSQLTNAVTQTIRDQIWPPVLEVLPTLYAKAAEMDVNVWGNLRKDARGRRKGVRFHVPYRPNVDLRGREYDFELEPGVGLAGIQGVIELQTLVGSGLMSAQTAVEQGDWTENAEEEMRRIDQMKMDNLVWADLQAKAGAGKLKPGALFKITQLIEKEGISFREAYARLDAAGEVTMEEPQMLPTEAGGAPAGAGGMPLPMVEMMRRQG